MLHFATWSKSICNTPFNERYGFLQGAKFMTTAALLSVRPALQARAFTLVIIFNCAMVRRRLSSSSSSFVFPKKSAQLCTLLLARASSSSFVIPKKSSQLCTLLLARARARQMASGGFAISISGTRNRSEIMESRVSKICMYCTIDYPGICTNNPACSLLAILANRQQWRQFSRS